MKILVVEDELKTGDYLRQGLMEAGFVVDLLRNGEDGLHAALGETYDLVILDVSDIRLRCERRPITSYLARLIAVLVKRRIYGASTSWQAGVRSSTYQIYASGMGANQPHRICPIYSPFYRRLGLGK